MKPRIVLVEPCSYDPDYNDKAFPPYKEAIRKSGGEVLEIQLDMELEQIVNEVASCSGILLTSCRADVDPRKYGAERHPACADSDPLREAVDELLLKHAYEMHTPLFGICYGMQSLNVFHGGTLNQQVGSLHQADHYVDIAADSLLFDAVGKKQIWVNSKHRQAVNTVTNGADLRVSAWATEDRVIEAVEGTTPDHYVLGLQWHPERDFDRNEDSRRIFQHFIQAAQKYSDLTEPGQERKTPGEQEFKLFYHALRQVLQKKSAATAPVIPLHGTR